MDPLTSALAAGVVGKIFGGGSPNMSQTNSQLELIRQIGKRAIDLYDNTDLEASDARAVALQQQIASDNAMRLLEQYDGISAAKGSSIFKSSTVKDRARSEIANSASESAASLAAQLETTRSQRKASLLPNVSNGVAGMQGSMAMDQFRNEQLAANEAGIFGLGSLLSQKTQSGGGGTSQYSSPIGPVDPSQLGKELAKVLGRYR
jgi:hypothetical protein